MVVAIQGFGSIWERRFGNDVSDHRAAYYNTTGVPVNGKLRYRWRIGGKLRFNSVSGFNPNYPLRALGRAFECAAPEQRNGWNQLLFARVLRTIDRPEFYLFAVTTERIGYVNAQSGSWKGDSVQIVSFSDGPSRQEILLLMPAYSWIRGEIGTFFVEPSATRPCSAQLQLGQV